MSEPSPDPTAELARLHRRLDRERASRHQAEQLSERGLRELYERKQQLEVLECVANAANRSASAEEALHVALEEVCRLSCWEVGHVCSVELKGGRRRLVSSGIWWLDDPEALAPFCDATKNATFGLGIGLPGRTLVARKAAWITDLALDDNFPRSQAARHCGLRSASAYPVFTGDEIVAVLEFFARAQREPDDGLLNVISQVGLQLGRAIERQRNDEMVQQRAEELVNARDVAQSANRAKSEFLANMSHELRTPLSSIIGFSELMVHEAFGKHAVPQYAEYSRHIYASGQHLLSIINDILDLSKIEAGKADLGYEEPLDLPGLVDEQYRTLRLHADKKHIAMRLAAEPNLPMLLGSERVMRQILTNLLSNALKFTPEDGTISTTVTLNVAGELVLAITDSGVGMTELEIAIALAPFGQVEGAHNRSHEGTGLGLPLARAMAALHQADFRILSTPGVGTTIEIIFPRERTSGGLPARACA